MPDLEEFNAGEMINPPFRALFIGKSATGKSECCKYWLKQLHDAKKIDAVLVVSGTSFNHFWDEVATVQLGKWDAAYIAKLLDERQAKIEKGEEVNQLCVILDDLIDNEIIDLTRDKVVGSLYSRGRHTKISIFTITQKLRKVSSTIRVNSDYAVFLSAANRKELEAIEEEYSIMRNKEEFYKMFEEYVHSYQYIVWSSANYSVDYFVDKAELVKDFKFPRFHRKPKGKKEEELKPPENKEEPREVKSAIHSSKLMRYKFGY